ncbi:hypothetical protein C9426_17690 [Serratia sp. S1B]|nr:hypothetical protein C9426_17690 [Serratia sp. S1B]
MLLHGGQWSCRCLTAIPFANQTTGVLATFVHPSHIVDYAPRDSLNCRLPVSRLNLGIHP